MKFLFFLPFILMLIWAYAAMFCALEIHPKIFKVIMIITGLGGILGFIAVIIAAALGVHL